MKRVAGRKESPVEDGVKEDPRRNRPEEGREVPSVWGWDEASRVTKGSLFLGTQWSEGRGGGTCGGSRGPQ